MKDSPVSVKRISGYGVAVAAVLGTSSAEAAINFVDIVPDATGSLTNNGAILLSFNLAGNVLTNGPRVADEQFFANHTYGTSKGIPSVYLHFGTTNGIAAFDSHRLAYGTGIGPGQTSNPTQTYATLTGAWKTAKGYWAPGNQGYLGLRFNNNGVANYGWADVTVVNDFTIVLNSFAYDDQGNPVAAGSLQPIPEPSQMALFALGAAGIAAYRRRKTAK